MVGEGWKLSRYSDQNNKHNKNFLNMIFVESDQACKEGIFYSEMRFKFTCLLFATNIGVYNEHR